MVQAGSACLNVKVVHQCDEHDDFRGRGWRPIRRIVPPRAKVIPILPGASYSLKRGVSAMTDVQQYVPPS